MIKKLCSVFMTGSEEDFAEFLKNQDSAILLKELLSVYANDKNSSFLRELVTCHMAGYEHSDKKLGYDGKFKEIPCEVKPQNVIIDSKSRLNGGGCFNDFTWRKFNQCQKDDLKMLMSGFVSGKMIYILEFPFNSQKFKDHLLENLHKYLPHGDEKNRYIRSCSWSLIHIDQITIRYLSSNFRQFKNKMTKRLFQFLELGEKTNAGPVT